MSSTSSTSKDMPTPLILKLPVEIIDMILLRTIPKFTIIENGGRLIRTGWEETSTKEAERIQEPYCEGFLVCKYLHARTEALFTEHTILRLKMTILSGTFPPLFTWELPDKASKGLKEPSHKLIYKFRNVFYLSGGSIRGSGTFGLSYRSLRDFTCLKNLWVMFQCSLPGPGNSAGVEPKCSEMGCKTVKQELEKMGCQGQFEVFNLDHSAFPEQYYHLQQKKLSDLYGMILSRFV